MNIWDDIKDIIGKRAVTVSESDLLTREEIIAFMSNIDSTTDYFFIKRDPKSKRVSIGLGGKAEEDDILALGLLAAAGDIVLSGDSDGETTE